jgi:pyruvate dehydrogenase complex dehydrogenase (E1) component
VTGGEKAQTLVRLREGDRSIPAARVRQDRALVLADRAAAARLDSNEKLEARVVSMPSWDIFEHQPQAYQDSVLPPDVTARVAVEQASTFGWERYVGRSGRVIGMKTFGASAPLKELQRKYGFEPERVTEVAKELLGRTKRSCARPSEGAPRAGIWSCRSRPILGNLRGAEK